jgi:hypothetical protein
MVINTNITNNLYIHLFPDALDSKVTTQEVKGFADTTTPQLRPGTLSLRPALERRSKIRFILANTMNKLAVISRR